jgi:DNA-binding NtrC family response regulator
MEYFRALLAASGGDVVIAAREAQLPRGTFYRLLKKYGVNPADFRGNTDPNGSRGPAVSP